MAYSLKEIAIRTNNSAEGMEKIEEIWKDIMEGRLPILFDSAHNFRQGVSPVSRYYNYESDESGDYDLAIMGVTADFFAEMEKKTAAGQYKKYDAGDAGGDLGVCAKKAWGQVWEEQSSGGIRRAFTVDYESSVPAQYTKDGKAHCYLYIAVQ